MTVAVQKSGSSEVTFLKILLAAQKECESRFKDGQNPFSVILSSSYDAVMALSNADRTSLLAHRPQAYEQVFTSDTFSGNRFSVKDVVTEALVSEIVTNFDVSIFEAHALAPWLDSCPKNLEAKVYRYLGGPTEVTVTAGGNGVPRRLGA